MNFNKLNPVEWVNEGCRKAHASLVVKCGEYEANPAQRRIMMMTAGATMLGMCATSAHADGFADMASHGADQSDSIKTYGGRFFAGAGFLLAGYGGFNWWKKGNEGEQSQIKMRQISGPMLGGMALGATGFFLVKAGETIGVQGASQAAIPQ